MNRTIYDYISSFDNDVSYVSIVYTSLIAVMFIYDKYHTLFEMWYSLLTTEFVTIEDDGELDENLKNAYSDL